MKRSIIFLLFFAVCASVVAHPPVPPPKFNRNDTAVSPGNYIVNKATDSLAFVTDDTVWLSPVGFILGAAKAYYTNGTGRTNLQLKSSHATDTRGNVLNTASGDAVWNFDAYNGDLVGANWAQIGQLDDSSFRIDIGGSGTYPWVEITVEQAQILKIAAGGITIGGSVPSTDYTLPTTDGTNDQVLKTNGSGVVTWGTDQGAGGALTYFTEADDADTSTLTATAPNTTVGFNDQLTMQGNDIIGVDSITMVGQLSVTPTGAVSGLYINQDNASHALEIDNDGAGNSIDINARFGMEVTQDIANGRALYLDRNLASESLALASMNINNASDGEAVLELNNDGTGPHITTGASNEDLEIDPNGTGDVSITGNISGPDTIATTYLIIGNDTIGVITGDNLSVSGDSLHSSGSTDSALVVQYAHVSDSLALALLKSGGTMTGDINTDSNLVTNLGYTTYRPLAGGQAHEEGLLFYDDDNKTFTIFNSESEVALQIGQESWVRARNITGSTISNGAVVYIDSAQGGLPTIDLADADSSQFCKIIGVATHDIEHNSNGFVTTLGLVRGLNTTAFNDGDSLFVDTAAGQFTANMFVAPICNVEVGYVTNAGASGDIFVSVGNLITLSTVDDVDTTGISSGDMLYWNGSIWVDTTLVVEFSDSTGAAVASDIVMDTIAAPTFFTVQHLQNIFHSAGWTTGGVFTDTTDGAGDVDSLYVAAGTGLIRTSDIAADTNAILFFDWGDTTIAIPADTTLFIGVKYNSGSPVVFDTTADKTLLDHQQNFELGTVTNEGGVLHLTFNPHAIGDHATLMIERTQGTMGIQRDNDLGGLILGETGTRNPTVTAGTLFSKLNSFAISAIDLSSSGSMDRYYRAAGSGFTKEAAVTQWNNTQWDDGDGGLATLANNKYAVQWFYLELDGNLISMYGRAEHNSLSLAEGESPPATVPLRLTVNQAKLIGRMLFQESSATAAEIQTVFTTSFPATAAEDHGNLGGLGDDDHPLSLLRSDFPDSLNTLSLFRRLDRTYFDTTLAGDDSVQVIFSDSAGVVSTDVMNHTLDSGEVMVLWRDTVATTKETILKVVSDSASLDTAVVANALTIPSAANPTTGADGRLAWDSDDEALEVYDGSNSMLIPARRKVEALIWFPDLVTDTVPIFYVDSILYPGGIEIIRAELQTSVDGAYSLIIPYYTAADPPVLSDYIDTLVVGAGDQRIASTTFENSTIAVGQFIYIITPATDIDWIRVSLNYYVKEFN